MPQPNPTDYAPFFQTYISLASSYLSASEALQSSFATVRGMLQGIPDIQSMYAYAPGKWTLKEMVQHITDTERIFTYRALCIARGDTTPLPGFDEKDYAIASGANAHKWEDIVEEWIGHRQSVIQLFKLLNDSQLARHGTVNHHSITPNALGFITAGHSLHHLNIIKERYLNTAYATTYGK
jgi:hypothetical protein